MAADLLKRKLNKLKDIVAAYRLVLIAYSGGVDSSFLLKSAVCFLGSENVLAITAVSPTYTQKELKAAKEIAEGLGVAHRVIDTNEVDDPRFKANPENRCYYCKSELFSRLQKIARTEGIAYVLDATNADDLKDYRPGQEAKKECGVHSPLAEAGMAKKDIRALSKEFGLKTWNAPQAACLASRFAYGQEITVEDLNRIEKAEEYIRSLGFKMVRVRHYQLPDKTKLARIEVDTKDMPNLVPASPAGRLRQSSLVHRLRKLGYTYVTLDLEGYRSGSMNEGIKHKFKI